MRARDREAGEFQGWRHASRSLHHCSDEREADERARVTVMNGTVLAGSPRPAEPSLLAQMLIAPPESQPNPRRRPEYLSFLSSLPPPPHNIPFSSPPQPTPHPRVRLWASISPSPLSFCLHRYVKLLIFFFLYIQMKKNFCTHLNV